MMTMPPSTPARGRHEVLLVDANPGLLAPVTSLLTAEGLGVRIARTRREMHEALTRRRPSLALLELDLPDVFGYEALRDLAIGASIPTIVYSVRVEAMDRVLSLELDAEDVIAKPCDPSEVLARVRRVLRRIDRYGATSHPGPGAWDEPPGVFALSGWRLDVNAQELRSPDGGLIPLTTGEFQLFALLALNANKVMRRERLLDAIS